MKIETIFKEFIGIYAHNELVIIEECDSNLEVISEIGQGESEIDDSLGFGEDLTILSNASAFIFLIVAEKLIELGFEMSRTKLLEVLVENKEKVTKLVKERYDVDVEKVLSMIIKFLESKK